MDTKIKHFNILKLNTSLFNAGKHIYYQLRKTSYIIFKTMRIEISRFVKNRRNQQEKRTIFKIFFKESSLSSEDCAIYAGHASRFVSLRKIIATTARPCRV